MFDPTSPAKLPARPPTLATQPSALSPAALRLLADNRRRFLALLPRGLVPDGDDEDVIQEAYLKALTTMSGPRDGERTLAWFGRLVRNTAIDRHRHLAAEERARNRWAADPTTAPGEAARDLPAAPCGCLELSMAALPATYQRVLRRVVAEGASIGAVAGELDVTPNTLRVRLHRARRALRGRLLARCGSERPGTCGRCSRGASGVGAAMEAVA